MGTFPVTPRADFLAWCTAHAEVFLDRAAAIGLTVQQADHYAAALAAARAAVQRQEEARLAAESATLAANAALAALRQQTSANIERVRMHAETTANPEVYALAQIPPIAAPSPVPPPGRITDLVATLEPTTGHVHLRFKCTNPSSAAGTTYLVRRKLRGESTFTFLGLADNKRFNDTTLPRGTTTAQYTVQAQRASLPGPVSMILTVNFGAVEHTSFQGDTNTADTAAVGTTCLSPTLSAA